MASPRRKTGPGKLACPTSPTALTRRRFLASTAAAGTLAALAPVLPAWGKDREKPKAGPTDRRRPLERHTLFFNLAHEAGAATSTYYLIVAGTEYRLNPITENARPLTRARRTNRFLRAVPDHQVTHVVESVDLAGSAVQLCYVKSDPDPMTGTWAMSSMFVHLPTTALTRAHGRARARVTAGPLPRSAKRQLYGHPAAETLDDLLEEQVLKDASDHAAAMIGFHPDHLSLDPVSAAHVHTNHIHTNGQTLGLAQRLQQAGPAIPQESSGQPNATGWATMEPLTDKNGIPIRATLGSNKGLIQYLPAWRDVVANHVGTAISAISPGVKDDETLGADVTGLDPSVSQPTTKGTIWGRHDGVTTVDQSPGASLRPGGSQPGWTTQNIETDAGFWVKDWNITTDAGSGDPLLTVDFVNWHPRHLGIWVQFFDANAEALALKDLGFKFLDQGSDTTRSEARQTFNEDKAAYGMVLPSSFQLFGVPVAPDIASLSVTIPRKATTVRIVSVGLGVLGPNDYPSLLAPGGWMTALVNYAVPMLAMAVGGIGWQSALKPFVAPILSLIAVECTNLREFNANDDPAGILKSIAIPLGRALLGLVPTLALKQVATAVAVELGAAAVDDSIPIVGQVMQAVAVVAGLAAILATTIDCLAVPHYYKWEVTGKHDVTVELEPDLNDKNFPAVANYYKVTAVFDGNNTTPHTQTLDMPAGTVSTLPPVVFKDVPRGGQINITVGFYSRSTDRTKNDWLAGQGTTGDVDNSQDQPHLIQIQEYKVPILSHTEYRHTQKTTLVDQAGQPGHVWTPTSIPPSTIAADIACEGPGSLCDFRGITVRQGTSQTPGYLGYSWKADSLGVLGCASGGQGQFDLLANLSTSDDPQSGYVTSPCGLPDGAQVAYTLMNHPAANFYLDSAAGIVRQVRLDQTPGFDPPNAKRAWGKLNLESTALLLHPAGKLVSINNANHKIEVLTLPAAPMSDADAQVNLLADVRSGQGSRPGLLRGPRAAAISPEGVILILEDQHRIQAVDTGGGPVQFFNKQRANTPYWLELTATEAEDTQYVDLAVEFTGYLYVLSFNRQTSEYRMDVYHPRQTETTPISTTREVNAARLAVDFWRNVYTLNYEVLQVPAGVAQALTEPSVSLWTPSPP